MYLTSAVWLFVLGVLGAANLIIAKKPDAKQLIDKLAPYQGWIGAVSAFWGAWRLVGGILAISWLSHATLMIPWVTWMAAGAIQLLLGFLLGFGIIKSWVKNPEASAKMDQTLAKLAPFQGTLGLIAMGLAVWYLIVPFMFTLAA